VKEFCISQNRSVTIFIFDGQIHTVAIFSGFYVPKIINVGSFYTGMLKNIISRRFLEESLLGFVRIIIKNHDLIARYVTFQHINF